MTTPYLGANLTLTAPQLRRAIGGTDATFGTALPNGQTFTWASTYPISNPVCRFRGHLYAMYRSTAGARIARSRDDGQTWEVVHTNGSSLDQSQTYCGLHVVYGISGQVYLTGLMNNGTNVTAYTSTDGTTWTSTGGIPVTGCTGVMPFGGRLYIGSYSTVVSFDPETLTSVASSVLSGSSPAWARPVAFNGDVCVLWGTGVGWRLARLIGMAESNMTALHGSEDFVSSVGPRHFAFVNPDNGNLIVMGRSYTQWHARSVDPLTGATFTSTNIAPSVITGSTLAGYTWTASRFVSVIYDQTANPGGPPAIYLAAAVNSTNTTPYTFFRWNGEGAMVGDAGGAPNFSGWQNRFSLPDGSIGGERFYTARPPGLDGVPEVAMTGRGSLVVNAARRRFRAHFPRSEILTTIGGVDATHDLSTTPISTTPIQPGSVAIRVTTVANGAQVITDDGAGNLTNVLALAAPGTIDYATGVLAGVTLTLTASSNVEALSNSGTVDVQIYRSNREEAYPGSLTPAPLSNPTHGSISGGDTIVNVPADGTEVQVSIAMPGFSSGDLFHLQPQVTP